MSTGRVQLAAVGVQEDFLTGDPDVTYFIKKFNRHTKFALEIFQVPFDQTTIDFGSSLTLTVPRRGQLIRSIYLKLVIPSLDLGGYIDSIGTAIIDHADLLIGGKTIERLNGEYIQIYNQVFLGESQQFALKYLTGQGLTDLNPATNPIELMVQLPFYFIRNESLSIPLCALTRQEVEVRIQLKSLDKLVTNPSCVPQGVLYASMPIEYVFIGDDEVSLIQSARIDYVITQIQCQRDVVPAGINEWNMRMENVNPVKEMFFVIQDQTANIYDFTNTFTGKDQLDKLEITFNNEIYLSQHIADELFLSILQFMNCHTRVPEIYIYNYSFSIDPENYLPTGQVNMSRILNKNIYFWLTDNSGTARDIRVYSKNYNILRIQNGMSGVIFTDSNFY